MITRKDYMDGKVTFEQYYSSVAKEAGLSMEEAGILERVKKALESGDEHLNSIPLAKWDKMGANPVLRANLSRSFKKHEDGMSLAGIVCVLKQACINAVKEEE